MKITSFLPNLNLILLCSILSSIIKLPNVSCSPPHQIINTTLYQYHYINRSCETTLYPNLCNKTLSKHAEKIHSSPKLLAMTALVATFNATWTTSKVLRNLRRRHVKPSEREALSECVEVVGDALYELQKSIRELNGTRRGAEFLRRMDDVQTWVSAALTDDDTCMDDFATVGNIRVIVRGFVLTIARLTSIALTFINDYAAL